MNDRRKTSHIFLTALCLPLGMLLVGLFCAEATGHAASMVKMSGKYRLGAGLGRDFILNDSNADLQERNFRYVFGERLNNTFDPAVYDQYLLNVDFSPRDKINFHTQLVADPWSWVGTTGEQVQRSDIGGEVMRYNLKYFGANNSVINEIWRTNVSDSIAFPIIKVHDGHTTQTVVHGFNDFSPATGGVPFTIPELDIDYHFKPIRKLWMDYNEDRWHFRVFALADETQALTTDDPLELSNHKDYWQQSPWLYEYKPIQFFEDRSIKRGYYSDNLSFLARDSEGNRLVLLKGAAVEADLGKTYIAGTIAAPYTPWDTDYIESNNFSAAARLKHQATDKLMVGSTYTSRTGLINQSMADWGQGLGIDTKYAVNPHVTIKTEIAGTHRERDLLTNERLRVDTEGYAYKGVVETKFDHKLDGSTEMALSYTQMDLDFDPLLSRYTNTRDDHFWGKHLTFTEYSPDMEHFRIGDGVDVNRAVVRFRWKEKLFKQKFENLIDLRNVHKTSNTAYKETVLREELTYRVNEQLTTKGLFRWQGLPKSTAGIEPFISNFYVADVADPVYQNAAVPADKDPSRFTYSGGLQYIFNKQWTAEGFVERTNDLSDFPRGLLNSSFRDANDRVDGLLIDHVTNFLYSQGPLGGIPPYKYFTIVRERVIYKPEDRTTITFHAAQNSYKFAGGIDDNINHQGVSVTFKPNDKATFFMDYTHSMQIDLPRLIATSLTESDFGDHHNFYASVDYKLNASQLLRAEYGVFGMGSNTPLVTPYSTGTFSLPTIDTEHLLRVSLTGDF